MVTTESPVMSLNIEALEKLSPEAACAVRKELGDEIAEATQGDLSAERCLLLEAAVDVFMALFPFLRAVPPAGMASSGQRDSNEVEALRCALMKYRLRLAASK